MVEAVARGRLVLRVEDVDASTPPPCAALVLVQALAKGGRDELAVETATELGVDAVVPWQAARSVVVWSGERGERAAAQVAGTARAAAKQSRRAARARGGEAVTTAATGAAAAATRTRVLVLHEDADQPLAAAPLPAPGTPGSCGSSSAPRAASPARSSRS